MGDSCHLRPDVLGIGYRAGAPARLPSGGHDRTRFSTSGAGFWPCCRSSSACARGHPALGLHPIHPPAPPSQRLHRLLPPNSLAAAVEGPLLRRVVALY